MVRLTYQELAARLTLSPAAASLRARRRRWPVTRGNDGKARVNVDEAELAAEAERVHGRSPEGSGARSPERSAHEAAQEVERWRTLAEERGMALARAEGELAAGQRTEAALRELVDELRRELERCRWPWWRRG
jgi:hypothetical protein